MKKNVHQKYYLRDLKRLISFLVPKQRTAVNLVEKNGKLETSKLRGKYAYLILNNLVGDLTDVQRELFKLQRFCRPDTRIVITYYNHLWEPVLKLASLLGLREVDKKRNWLDKGDLINLLNLAGFETTNHQQRMLVPLDFGIFSNMFNKWIGSLPLFNSLCLTTWVIARVKPKTKKEYSVSIIVPTRNEAGNIPKTIKHIPKFGKWQEVIFVEGHSTDNTWEMIEKEMNKKHSRNVTVGALKQKGKGKADAVRLGFKKAKGEVLMILDGDLTVDPKELPKFYNVLSSGEGEFVNGSRLVYPMEKQAMQTLNKLGNMIFGWLFSYILGQRFKDTLCGTKVLFRKDYEKIVKGRKYFGNFDPFGDFDLIFGAVKLNLKVIEIPVRYKERRYGSTNISRFKHGWLLLKMTWFGFKKFRAW
jgi:hypothetical protein